MLYNMDIVFGSDHFPRPVEMAVRVKFRRSYLCKSHLYSKVIKETRECL